MDRRLLGSILVLAACGGGEERPSVDGAPFIDATIDDAHTDVMRAMRGF
jgi:hypothetical protein